MRITCQWCSKFCDCFQTVCHEGEGANPGWDQQLVVYSPPQFLQPLQQKERRVEFASREWIIQQDWDSIGVAAVVWEPVSYIEGQN